MSITLDDSSKAALPGGINIDLTKFLDYYELGGLPRFLFKRLLNKPLETLKKKSGRSKIIFLYVHTNEHFEFGCVNPSIILDATRGLVATYTDLTNDGGEATSVIKIEQVTEPVFHDMAFKDMEEVATVSLYQQDETNENARAWKDFKPLLPHLFTADLGKCDAMKKRLNSAEWKCLHEGLKQIPNVHEEGLYHVNLDSELTDQTYITE